MRNLTPTIAFLALASILASCGKSAPPKMPLVNGKDPLVDTGEHSITSQSKDSVYVFLRFKLMLVGFEELRRECYNRTSSGGAQTYVAGLVTESMQKLIEETDYAGITFDAVKQKLRDDIIDLLNEKLGEDGDPPDIKLFKGVLLWDFVKR